MDKNCTAPLQWRRSAAFWSAFRKVVGSRLKEAILPFYSELVIPHLQCCVQHRAPQYNRDMQLLEKVQWKTTYIMKRLEHLTCKKAERVRTVCLEIRRHWGESHPCVETPEEKNEEHTARNYTVILSKGRRGNEHKLIYGEFSLNGRKKKYHGSDDSWKYLKPTWL